MRPLTSEEALVVAIVLLLASLIIAGAWLAIGPLPLMMD